MKIGFTGLDIPEGKTKYNDKILAALVEKDNPKKVSPYFAEFIRDEYVQSDVIVINRDNLLDLLILDMDKVETRMQRSDDEEERTLMNRCLAELEKEIPLSEVPYSAAELEVLNGISPHSLKPVLILDGMSDVNDVIEAALEKAGYLFFYTSGPTESHAWLVKAGSDIVTCAAAIHSDLARGFIKADIVTFEDYMNNHNFKTCISQGVSKLVDRDYIIQPGDIIEIRFSV